MGIRLFVMAACFAALSLSVPAFAQDDIPDPVGVPMGPVQQGDPDAMQGRGTGSVPEAGRDAAAAAADPNDEADQNAVGQVFDGPSPNADPEDPDGNHGTVVEPNSDPDSSAE